MKIRILLLSLICAVGTVPVALHAADKEETELGNHMDKMSGAMRKLKKQVADPKQNAESLALVATIKKEAAEAAKLDPAWKADKPAGDQAKFVSDYQASMKELITKIDALEAAFKANNNTEAAKIVDELGAAQKKGHKQFKKPETKK
jgi:soluble cytochrome b562